MVKRKKKKNNIGSIKVKLVYSTESENCIFFTLIFSHYLRNLYVAIHKTMTKLTVTVYVFIQTSEM